MAGVRQVSEIMLPAGEDLTGDKFKAGTWNGTGVVVAADGVIPDVIIMSAPATVGDGAVCYHLNTSMVVSVILGGTVSAGVGLKPSSGAFIETTSADLHVLTAMEGGASGEIIQALVHHRKAAA